MCTCQLCGGEGECCQILNEQLMESSLTPVSRESMKGLKFETDEKIRIQEEKIRQENIQGILKNIYNIAIQEARTTTNTYVQIDSENHLTFSQFMNDIRSKLFVKNMKEIVKGLEELFPGCSVRHFTVNDTQLNRGSTIQRTFITIDWS